MIQLPRRSVTRFFIPLVDVLTLLFCVFLIMQAVSFLVPATHFMEILRGIVLRGATFMDLLPEVVTLSIMGLVLLVLSAVQFHKKLA